MAPRGRRGEADEAQPVYQLGQQGRKTGISLANTGQRDEHGFAPLDSLFSSPQKAPARASQNGREEEEGPESDDGSQAMEIPSSAGPGPNTVLRQQRQSRVPMSRSPVKTNLMSPARRSPLVGSSPNKSSPRRPTCVRRTLDFQSPAQTGASRFGRANGINGSRVQEVEESEEEEEPEPELQHFDDPGPEYEPPMGPNDDDMVDALLGDDDSLDGDDGGMHMKEPSPPPPPPSSEKRKPAPMPARKGSRQPTVSASPAASKTKQRPTVSKSVREESKEPDRQHKRQKTTNEPPKPAQKPGSRPRGRPPGSKSKAQAKPAPPGRKPRSALSAINEDEEDDVGETSFAALQKGPPMPRRPGLVSMKRDPDVITQTRSGRHSYRPLNYWAGEQVITEDEEREDMFTHDRGFVMGSMKDIKRVEEDEPRQRPAQPRRRGRPPKTKNKRQIPEEEEIDEAEEPEEWETDPAAGHVMGEVIAWEPEYETQPPGDDDLVHISEEQIAISGHGIQTVEVSEAEFRFAKTLTMPFMGAGIVDLPPGTEKRPKNSRKMHLVFFVHYGKVAVWVNEGHFRISAGGQWFVPRGNHYSIINDYNQPARIFFAQACEMTAQPLEEEEEEEEDVEGETSLVQ